MKDLFFSSEFTPSRDSGNGGRERNSFRSDERMLPILIRNLWRKSAGIIVLLIAMMSLFLVSCDEPDQQAEEWIPNELKSVPDFMTMTKEELIEFFENADPSQLKSSYTRTWTDTLSAEEFAKYRRLSPLRASYDCDVEIKPILDPPLDSIYVTVYEAGTTNVYRPKEKLGDREGVSMTINGDDYYDFEVEHPDNPSGNVSGYLQINPVWGGKTLYFFPTYPGPHTFYDYNFECPEPSLDGTCDAYISVYHKSGTATGFEALVIDNTFDIQDVTGITGNPSQSVPFVCDETKSYTFYIEAINGSSSERFDVAIIRPDGVSHGYNFFNEDMTNGRILVTKDFDYFECPY